MSWSHIRVNRLSTYIRYLRLIHTLLAFFLDQSFPCANYLKEFFCKKCPFTIRMTCRDRMVKNETYKTLTDLYSKNISLKVMKSVKLISISKISPPIWSWRLLQVDQKESKSYFKSLWDERVLFMFSLANGKKQHDCISFFRSMSACVFLLK